MTRDPETLPGDMRLEDADASTRYAFPDKPCGDVADMMVESGVGRVPIVDHESRTVVGIISRQDLLKVHSKQKSGELR